MHSPTSRRRSAAPLALLAASFLLACLSAAPVVAENGFYLSAKFGQTDVDLDVESTVEAVLDGDDDSRGFEVGYRFLRWLGVQAGYHDLGSFDLADGCEACGFLDDLALGVPLEVDSKAYSIAGVAQVPLLPFLSVFGKMGYARIETDVSSTVLDTEFDFDDTTEEPLIGAGVRVKIVPTLISLFAEWERLGDDIETVSVGATIHF